MTFADRHIGPDADAQTQMLKAIGYASLWPNSYGVEPLDRLWISPSCGFGRHPARTRPVLREKLEHMMEAASSF